MEDTNTSFITLNNSLMTTPVLASPNFDFTFLDETDASEFEVGEILKQKKGGGKFNPIQFTSRTMTYCEIRYAFYECEALAAILSLKKFCLYVLSYNTFKVMMDHKEISYTFNKKGINGRLASWMNFFSASINSK